MWANVDLGSIAMAITASRPAQRSRSLGVGLCWPGRADNAVTSTSRRLEADCSGAACVIDSSNTEGGTNDR